DV
ncbi:hypothetical protein D047_1546B, partial [Vibrio parahaemolyticus VPTS-2010_2]